jgi:hypothetical protein
VPDETQPGHHGERGAQHDQHLGGVNQRVRLRDPVPGHRFAEEHHVGLQPAATLGAVGQYEVVPLLDHRVTVRSQLGVFQPGRRGKIGVELSQPMLHHQPGRESLAVQADHPGDVAVQVDHPAAARGLMQSVHILE